MFVWRIGSLTENIIATYLETTDRVVRPSRVDCSTVIFVTKTKLKWLQTKKITYSLMKTEAETNKWKLNEKIEND